MENEQIETARRAEESSAEHDTSDLLLQVSFDQRDDWDGKQRNFRASSPTVTVTPQRASRPVRRDERERERERTQRSSANRSGRRASQALEQSATITVEQWQSLSLPTDYGPVNLVVRNLDYNLSLSEWVTYLQLQVEKNARSALISAYLDDARAPYAVVRVRNVREANSVIIKLHNKKHGYKKVQLSVLPDAALCSHLLGVSLDSEHAVDNQPEPRVRSLTAGRGRSRVGAHPSVCRTLATLTPCEPKVVVNLTPFTSRAHQLLAQHGGAMALGSFAHCYRAAYGEMATSDRYGVHLERVLRSVRGLRVEMCAVSKAVRLDTDTLHVPVTMRRRSVTTLAVLPSDSLRTIGATPPAAAQCVSLLAQFPGCIAPRATLHALLQRFGNDVPRSRVQDQRHILENIGCDEQLVTLTSCVQVKRFAIHLMAMFRVLKVDKLTFWQLAPAYKTVHQRELDTADFGFCTLEDLVAQLPADWFALEHRVASSATPLSGGEFSGSAVEQVASVTRRLFASLEAGYIVHDRTVWPLDAARLRALARELVDLVCEAAHCRVPLDSLAQRYRERFRRPLLASDYGATMASLMDVVHASQCLECALDLANATNYVQLTPNEQLRVFAHRTRQLLESTVHRRVPTYDFCTMFARAHGYAPRCADFQTRTLDDLVSKINRVARIVTVDGQQYVAMREGAKRHAELRLVLDKLFSSDCLAARRAHLQCGVKNLDNLLVKYLDSVLTCDCTRDLLRLKPFYVAVANMRRLVEKHAGCMLEEQLIAQFLANGVLNLTQLGYHSLEALLRDADFAFVCESRSTKQKKVTLVPDWIGKLAYNLTYSYDREVLLTCDDLGWLNDLPAAMGIASEAESDLAKKSEKEMDPLQIVTTLQRSVVGNASPEEREQAIGAFYSQVRQPFFANLINFKLNWLRSTL